MRSPTMKRQLRVMVLTAALGPLVYWGPGMLEAVRGLDMFAVQTVNVTGIEVLTEEAVIERMDLGSFASVWGDVELWRARIEADPLVRSVEIHRRVPHGLLVQVEERIPVALAATPLLEALDADGVRLRLDPTVHRLDLPIISSRQSLPDDAVVFPDEVSSLAAEVEHLTATHQDFAHRISTIRWYAPGVVAVRLTSPDVDFVMPMRTTGSRIREGESALGHAMQERAGRPPAEVDLRFAEQVVIRSESSGPALSTLSAGSR